MGGGGHGAKRAIMVSLVLWTATLIYLFAWVYTTRDFFIAAAMVAIVMGGSQALSRSLFAQLIPKGKEAEYFSIYEVSDKGTSWISPLVFGLALQMTHSYRQAILSLIIFFIAGLVVLTRVDVKRGALDAQAVEQLSACESAAPSNRVHWAASRSGRRGRRGRMRLCKKRGCDRCRAAPA